MVMKKILQYEFYVFIGMLMVVGTVAKLIFGIDIDSDWFWFIAGVALVLDGSMNFVKQRQFKSKYKIISRKEFDEVWSKLEPTKK